MRCRHARLLLIFVYVVLDLSLSEMPGAFVFDPAESVESIDVARGRLTLKLAVLPNPGRMGSMAVQHSLRSDVGEPLLVAPPRCPPVVKCLPRATMYAPSRSSEDPH